MFLFWERFKSFSRAVLFMFNVRHHFDEVREPPKMIEKLEAVCIQMGRLGYTDVQKKITCHMYAYDPRFGEHYTAKHLEASLGKPLGPNLEGLLRKGIIRKERGRAKNRVAAYERAMSIDDLIEYLSGPEAPLELEALSEYRELPVARKKILDLLFSNASEWYSRRDLHSKTSVSMSKSMLKPVLDTGLVKVQKKKDKNTNHLALHYKLNEEEFKVRREEPGD